MSNLGYPATIYDSTGTERISNGTVAFTTPTNTPSILYFPFTYQTAGLAAGVTIYTPTVGTIIEDIGVVITTAFNGTTPKIDIGTFNGGNNGLFDELATAPVDATKVYADVTNNAGLASANSALWLSAAVVSHGITGSSAISSPQLRVSAANPILLVASQSGAKGGTAITSTQGAGTIYIVAQVAQLA